MTNLTDKIVDILTKHDIDLHRVEASVSKEIIGMINGLSAQLRKRILKFDPTSVKNPIFINKRLKQLVSVAGGDIDQVYATLEKTLAAELKDIALLEGRTTTDTINRAMQVELASKHVNASKLKALASRSMIEGAVVKSWWKNQSTWLKDAFKRNMQEGIIGGEDIGTLVRRIRGTRESGFTDGLMRTPTHAARRLARSAVITVANDARVMTFEENADVIKGMQWLSTFDSRTSDQCIALDGQSWFLDGRKMKGTTADWRGPPPAHWNAYSEGTLITTEKGQVPIENIKIGDSVLTHKGRYKKVSATMSKRNDTNFINRLTTDSGRIFFATDDHPILVVDRGWIRIDDIIINDKLFELNNGIKWNTPLVIDIHKIDYIGMVYNLSVEDDESYIAENIVTHNCRSTIVPITKTFSEMNRNPDLKGKLKKADKATQNTLRQSADGGASAKLNYEGWLKKRPKSEQIEVLGRTKYKLWKEGKIGFTDLIDQSHNSISTDVLLKRFDK